MNHLRLQPITKNRCTQGLELLNWELVWIVSALNCLESLYWLLSSCCSHVSDIIAVLGKLVTHEYPGIVILGPTASGKSKLAIELSLRFRGEIVSCDALQVYRRMDIGTAKVSPAEREMVRHHMLDLRDPDEDFSAGDYQRLARVALSEIRSRSNLPFIVGGTGFYLKALIEGLFEGPARSEELRARMREIIRHRGAKTLHRALCRVDPESADRIAEADSERIIRAYEVHLVSGKSISWWQQQPRDALTGYRWLKFGIDLPRQLLYQRINQRVEEMFEGGLVEEAKGLLNNYPKLIQAFKAIGYRQIGEYLDGALSVAQAIDSTQMESRRYAKRQMTWFRSDPDILWLDGRLEFSELCKQAESHITNFLNK
jgi:tRNA dimethylallyltransferase